MKQVIDGQNTIAPGNHYFKIKDKCTNKVYDLVGYVWYLYGGVVGYQFDKKDNPLFIKEIEYKNKTYSVIQTFNKVSIPLIDVISHEIDEQDDDKEDLLYDLHIALSNYCKGLGVTFVKFDPVISINLLSLNKMIDLEYITFNSFGGSDIINYRTDHIEINELSFDEIKKILYFVNNNIIKDHTKKEFVLQLDKIVGKINL